MRSNSLGDNAPHHFEELFEVDLTISVNIYLIDDLVYHIHGYRVIGYFSLKHVSHFEAVNLSTIVHIKHHESVSQIFLSHKDLSVQCRSNEF